MDLFQKAKNDTPPKKQLKPLAEQMRPESLEDFIGQTHLVGNGQILADLIASRQIPSLILWGPPGVGKTTLARIIAQHADARFVTLSAVSSGIKDVKEVVERARFELDQHQKQTILFIDEIHRFNKAQQDAFLPHVENGTITLIGATTENPSFEVISALLSRCKVFTLKPLTPKDLDQIIDRTLQKKHKRDFLDQSARKFLIDSSYGDARYLLNILEDLLNIFSNENTLTGEQVQEKITRRSHLYDKNAEHHYNVISAFIKSMRGSNPDAALYYLARMLDSGEDPLFIARRMIIFASEDIGLANPQAVQVAVACMESFQFIGAAEGWIPLAQCAVYLAGSPKSNSSYNGYKLALEDVRKHGPLEVPHHLRNAPTSLMKDLGYGQGYKYAHSFQGNKVDQEYLPAEIKTKKYYIPTENGHERKIKEWLDK